MEPTRNAAGTHPVTAAQYMWDKEVVEWDGHTIHGADWVISIDETMGDRGDTTTHEATMRVTIDSGRLSGIQTLAPYDVATWILAAIGQIASDDCDNLPMDVDEIDPGHYRVTSEDGGWTADLFDISRLNPVADWEIPCDNDRRAVHSRGSRRQRGE